MKKTKGILTNIMILIGVAVLLVATSSCTIDMDKKYYYYYGENMDPNIDNEDAIPDLCCYQFKKEF